MNRFPYIAIFVLFISSIGLVPRFQFKTYFYPFKTNINIVQIQKKETFGQVEIKGIKEGLCNEYIDQLLKFNLTYKKYRDKLLYGFWNNTEDFDYAKFFTRADLVPKFGKKEFIDKINRFEGKIAIYKNAYGTYSGEFAVDGYIIRPPFASGPAWIRVYTNGPVVYQCENACLFGHKALNNIGHFMNDYLQPLILLPKEFRENCVCIINSLSMLNGDELLRAINVSKYIYVKEGEWVFAKRLAVAVEGRPHYMHYGMSLQILVDKLREYYKLPEIEPTRYIIFNRANKTNRHILNIDDIIARMKTDIPVKFEYVPDWIGPYYEYAKFFSSVKCMFTAAGSNCHKTVFMKKGTVAAIVGSQMFDYGALSTLMSVGIRVAVAHHQFWHFYNKCVCDVDLAIKTIRVAVYYSVNNTWPEPIPNVTFVDYDRVRYK
ncbi:hypothetical protein TVAG_266390 [Trichomonas vaginalis G3]|uniref:Glycosyltransferase 61 catalytic domain-containing protein n=1 Tax=Trichomonas vaginalis (strain ATCC PRA-98 / G3) TaxID=412133 RepID=A2DQJ2_TRIV3|nr:glycosyltransferase family [Trichomonas vaginalis G3]EAY17276.1 hypothetical protein TVAG_266390 [Trichomonas vaginalis G3]KAI5523268.1 glycosyltransferase family [Trichomonas vaginalis G3]|eukprot:XP_001329499.1 hypothetical protein [Trichomonas vaginalis G3]